MKDWRDIEARREYLNSLGFSKNKTADDAWVLAMTQQG